MVDSCPLQAASFENVPLAQSNHNELHAENDGAEQETRRECHRQEHWPTDSEVQVTKMSSGSVSPAAELTQHHKREKEKEEEEEEERKREREQRQQQQQQEQQVVVAIDLESAAHDKVISNYHHQLLAQEQPGKTEHSAENSNRLLPEHAEKQHQQQQQQPLYQATDERSVAVLTDSNGELHHYQQLEGLEAQEAHQINPCPTPTDAMRHPQESHHRPQPLGEVESGEESDCVGVAATTAERKVEPLKINLARDREPIRTIIKLPGAGSLEHHGGAQLSPTIREIPGSPKTITIKPPKPPPSATATTDSTHSGGGGNGDHNINSVPASNSIPKLTIKPLLNPAVDEETATADDPTTVGANASSSEHMQIIPKLLIKGSSSVLESGGAAGRDVAMEPHIVPKLTIRGVNNHNHHHHHHHHHHQHQHAHHHSQQQPQSQHSQSVVAGDGHSQPPQHAAYSNNVASASLLIDGSGGGVAGPSGSASSGSPNTPLVPKLTIKMDNHHHHGHVQQHSSMENASIPKLHIKTIPPDGSSGVLLLTTASATSSMAAGMVAGTSSTSSGGSTAPAGTSPVLTSSEGVKLTIKPLPEQPKLPKLTIKTTGLGTIAETSDASLVSSTSSSFSPKTELQVLVATSNSGATTSVNRVQLGSPSTTAHHHQYQHHHHHQAQLQPSSPSDQHSNISSSSIPKLTIKPIPAKQTGDNGTGSASAGDLPTVPKLTIKPIPPPSTATKQQQQQRGDTGSGSSSNSTTTTETSINALEPSSVSSSSANAIITMSPTSSHSPTTSALKMKIKVPPAVQSGSSESSSANSALMAALSGPLLATGSGTASAASNMTRLNIKPILPPGLNACTGMPAGEQHRVVTLTEGSGEDKEGTSGASTPPSGEEEQDPSVPIVIPKVTIKTLANASGQETEIISTPKVTLKPIPKPVAHQSESVLGSESSRNASPVTADALDSPRIILKINKGSSSTTTTSNNATCDQQTLAEEGMLASDGTTMAAESSHHSLSASPGSSLLANELKRPATASASGGKVDHSALPSSSSASCASSTSVSVSTSSSSSGGSDPASPSSGSGGDHGGDPGSPEAKKSKLDDRIIALNERPPIAHSVLQQTLQQQNRPPYSYHHLQHQQHQLKSTASVVATTLVQRRPQPPSSSDVIIIDDDSKSGNETPGNVREAETPPPSRSTVGSDALVNSASSRLQQHLLGQEVDADIEEMALNAAMAKPRRTRGTPRGGRQSRRGSGGRRGAMQNAAARAALNNSQPALSHSPSLQGRTATTMYLMNNEERDEGSSSDCMIVDEPSSAAGATRTAAGGSGSSSKSSSSSLTSTGSGSLYNNTVASGSEMEKNGTASNSSVGSVASSTMGHLPSMTPVPASSGTPGAGVRMSTRRGAGQLLKEVLSNKTHDRDSGVDEARTDGEAGGAGGLHGPTPSKRPRGRPKKQLMELGMMETNGGGGSSNSIESLMTMMTSDGILLTQSTPSTREDTTPSYPSTPARTPRTRGRGRGRGRGRTQPIKTDITPNLGGSFFASPSGLVDPNEDPLFIASNTISSAFGSESDGGGNFNQLFHSVQTSAPRTGRGSRGPRRGGGRGSRTPRGGGRGAAKAAARLAALEMAALAAVAAAAAENAGGVDPSCWSPSSELGGMVNAHHTADVSSFETPKVGRRPRGRGASAGVRRSAMAARTPRGKKAAALAAAAAALAAQESTKTTEDTAGDSPDAPNNIFMTPMAGGLELFRSKLNFRELKTPKNAIKSNTPLSSGGQTSGASPLEGATPGSGSNLQLFEEDTRMSGDLNYNTPVRLMNAVDGCLQQNEESQSSYLSSTSVTQDASNYATVAGATNNGIAQSAAPDAVGQKDAGGLPTASGAAGLGNNSNSSRRPKGKMEVLDVHRAQFTVDLLAEYEWPPPIAGQRTTDSFMIQEQIAEYLGVKSFKRKYPDLMRRPVDMEERNFILERGLASEKMCDLGLTAVYASEILDIMCTDYPEKYEEYTRYIREKHIRELSSRQRQQQEAVAAAAAAAAAVAAPIDRAQLQKDKAIESAASWNSTFNKDRRDMRRACMDLQTYVVHVPRRYQNPLANTEDSTRKMPQTTNYPVALVPGQFSEYYTTYTPEELACYPINTVLLEPQELEAIVSSERYKRLAAQEARRLAAQEAGYSSSGSSSSSSGSSSDGDSSSSNSDSDSNDSSDGSGTSSCTEDDGRGSTDDDRHSLGSASSGGLSVNAGLGDDATGGRKKRLRRKRRVASRMMPMRSVGGNEEQQKNVRPTAMVTPVRRSSRALSAGTTAPVVEVKTPTDSDDSDVPLIAHATKKKNAVAALTATVSSGKQMVVVKQEQLAMKRPPLNPFMCAVCSGPENKNKYSKPERFVRCNRCRRKAHPSCIGMSSVMYRRVQQYKWQCSECKLCMKCNRKPAAIDSKMVYCDQCDRGYHLACKGLRNLPDGRWHCSLCTICSQCGAQTPEGHPNAQLTVQQRQHLAMVAEWTHEYGVNALTQIREHLRTLCMPCMRQRRQRLQSLEPELSQAATATLVSSDNKETLNNNNNIDSHSRVTVTEYTGDHRKSSPTMPFRSMPVGVASNNLAVGNAPISSVVGTNGSSVVMRSIGPGEGGIGGGGAGVSIIRTS
ncbi:supporter of activation of yellow protein-like isoform X2 [Anopheles albimanus]|uniref:supporter of activation of yellow protein-like isoform X2 n=1 Tax=Anopheles albimanus TaxID=7167 RepID=UPI001640D6A3|nr:supporter of activation of yellow protein-like isoform X2 [Anopheles albimanus]